MPAPRAPSRRRRAHTPATTGRASLPNAIWPAAPSIRRCAVAVMDTPAPCAQWPTACSISPAPCSATASASTRTVPGPPPRERRDARSGGRGCASTGSGASTGHPVMARASLNEAEENTTTALAKWWGVLFSLPFPGLGRAEAAVVEAAVCRRCCCGAVRQSLVRERWSSSHPAWVSAQRARTRRRHLAGCGTRRTTRGRRAPSGAPARSRAATCHKASGHRAAGQDARLARP